MVPVTDPFVKTINTLFAQLAACVENVNRPTDLAGLASFHILQNENAVHWNVHVPPQDWVQQHSNELDQAPHLAILGYLMFADRDRNAAALAQCKAEFLSHFQRLIQRQNIFTTPNSWILQPTIILGIALGALACGEDSATRWLQAKLAEGVQRTDLSLYLRLLYHYASCLLENSQAELPLFPFPSFDAGSITLSERALTIWLTQREMLKPPVAQVEMWLGSAQGELLELALSKDLGAIGDEKAALLFQVLATYVNARSRLPTLDLVKALLSNFLPAMERWQKKWKIGDEYDLQAILWLILRTAFSDVRYEEYLPKRGRSGHRYDIGIPTLGLLIEAKYIYKADEFQKIVDEVGKDAAQITTQRAFTGFFVFVYDSSRSNQHHDWASRALLDTERVRGCVIVSAPSHLPSAPKKPRKLSRISVRSARRARKAVDN